MTEEVKEQEIEEKEMVSSAEIVGDYVPHGVVSFEELDGVKQSEAAGQMARSLSHQFQAMVSNIFMRDDVEDKADAIKSLASEFAQRIDDAMEQKEIDEKAVWSTKRVNTFPDSSFLHILKGGKKDSQPANVPLQRRERQNRPSASPQRNRPHSTEQPHRRIHQNPSANQGAQYPQETTERN
jgi:hypothetical protein